ncbi:MAG: hypothetical protein FWH24_00290 [Oscillospiraceae bacterium]|nr:hypothetical protein [Oscillospiraceae bacterium]
MLPTTNFFGTQITRLILGDNPAHGNTYIPDLITREEMTGYFTPDNIVKMLFSSQDAGYNTVLALASPLMLDALRRFKAEGGKLHIIFQTYPPSIDNFAQNIDEMAEFDPIAIYHQGSTGETLIENEEIDVYLKNIGTIKKTGLPTGIALHVPENVQRAEKENWGADFYVLCPYNIRRNRKGHVSSFITGESKAWVVFHPDDRLVMFPIVRQLNKPVIIIKAFAGGQIYMGRKKEEYPAITEQYLAETYENIKPSDVVCVGVFQRDTDQIRQNAEITARILK